MTITAVILDDEPLARQRLRDLLKPHPDIVVIGEAGDVPTACTMATEGKPDVLFLDVVMPRGSGLEVLRSLSPRPQIIFTTAYSHYAVTAFDENATDYLVKPIRPDRLDLALRRLRRTLGRESAGTGSPRPQMPTRIAVRHRNDLVFVTVADITWIAAEGNYSRVHTKSESYLVRGLLNHLEAKLGAERFVRIHRSFMVNIGSIRKVVPVGTGHCVILENGTPVRIGCSYRAALTQLLDSVL